jgi:hypothetical protein
MRHQGRLASVIPLLAALALTQTASAYYSPRLGRFISRDPIEEEGGVNAYAYIRNSGPNAEDPLGLEEGSSGEGGGAGAASAATQPACQCGADVTQKLDKVLAKLEWQFNSLSVSQKEALCQATMFLAWDIFEFTEAGKGSPGPLAQFQSGSCGTGACAGTVTYRGGCYWASELNYLVWGRMRRKCADALNRKGVLADLDRLLGFAGTTAYTNITLEGALTSVVTYRSAMGVVYGKFFQSSCSFTRPGAAIGPRVSVTMAGWYWDHSKMKSADVSKQCAPCRAKMTGTLWGHVGLFNELSQTE